jgi:hypothetical protein
VPCVQLQCECTRCWKGGEQPPHSLADDDDIGAPALDEAERKLAETLRSAAWIFEYEKHGRFQGSILACPAVARFIASRGGGAELAAPFVHIAEAFICLEKGGTPRLFSKKTMPEKERERSPERKHLQRLAAMALEVLIRLDRLEKKESDVNVLADSIARKIEHWPGMSAQKPTGKTVAAWRKQLREAGDRLGDEKFNELVHLTLAEPDPRRTVEKLLLIGPPGQFQG